MGLKPAEFSEITFEVGTQLTIEHYIYFYRKVLVEWIGKWLDDSHIKSMNTKVYI